MLIETEKDDGNREEFDDNKGDEDDDEEEKEDDEEVDDEEVEEDEVEWRGQGTIRTASPPIFKNEITGSLSTPCIRNCSSKGCGFGRTLSRTFAGIRTNSKVLSIVASVIGGHSRK